MEVYSRTDRQREVEQSENGESGYPYTIELNTPYLRVLRLCVSPTVALPVILSLSGII